MDDANVEPDEWWELAKVQFQEEVQKNLVMIEGMKLFIEDIYFPSRKPFEILFITIQVAQNCLVRYQRWKKLSALE